MRRELGGGWAAEDAVSLGCGTIAAPRDMGHASVRWHSAMELDVLGVCRQPRPAPLSHRDPLAFGNN